MEKLNAIKDGKGNIIISEDSFEMILNCLDNQKFIDNYNKECRNILNRKYVLRTESDGYFLAKRYENQTEDTQWTEVDVGLVYELFKDTRIVYKETRNILPLDGSEKIMEGIKPIGKTEDGWIAVEPEPRPWLIERSLRYDYDYLTISEDGKKNRPWKKDEIEKITKIVNQEKIK